MTAARRAGLQGPSMIAAGVLLVVLLAATVLATGGRAGRLADAGRQALADTGRLLSKETPRGGLIAPAPGWRIAQVHLQGASRASQDEILAAAGVRPGLPILGLDLDAIRRRVEKVGWVEHARIIRLLPDTLVIAVSERPLAAVWQHDGRRDVVAADGHVVAAVDPASFHGLPLLVGEGANLQAAALLPQVMGRPRLAQRLLALRRVDARRWDLIMKDGGVIQLPPSGEGAALERLDRLDRRGRILELGLSRIDLREPDYTIVRPRTAADAQATHGT